MQRRGRPKGIIIHHSLTKDGKTESWDSIKKYHIEEKGWDDIGYHFGIEYIGDRVMILTGRGVDQVGGHCIGKNDYLGICLVGNYDVQEPEQDKLFVLAGLTATLLKQFGLLPSTVYPHSKFAQKSCPGRMFPWDRFMSMVSERI